MDTDNREQGDIAANVLLHTQMLVSGLDDLEGKTIFRQALKKLGNNFKRELESTTKEVHRNVSEDQNKAILACYDDYLSILNQLDSLTVQERHQLNKELPKLINDIKAQA